MGLLQRLDASLLDMAEIAIVVFTCVSKMYSSDKGSCLGC